MCLGLEVKLARLTPAPYFLVLFGSLSHGHAGVGNIGNISQELPKALIIALGFAVELLNLCSLLSIFRDFG